MADEHEIAAASTLFSDQALWASALADRLEAGLAAALAAKPSALLAVAGGTTPGPALRALAQRALDWSRIVIAPSDERQVPPDHAARNDRMIAQALARPVSALSALDPGALPDVALVGFGLDRHVASVFPAGEGMAAAAATDAAAPTIRATTPDPLPPEAPFPRLTFTLAALAKAEALVIAATGAAKRAALANALNERPPHSPLAQLLTMRPDAAVLILDPP